MYQENYKTLISQERHRFIPKPYDLVFQCFMEMGLSEKNEKFFKENASWLVQRIRDEAWKKYVSMESDFMDYVNGIVARTLDYNGKTQEEAVIHFLATHSQYVYDLNLSNTQSRRSRAGKEFEAIIELIFMGAGIEIDSQGNVAGEFFSERGLGKSVDLVVPGAVEFELNKRNVALISAKTSLRERWQEVVEEMTRTGVSEVYLVTLDEGISDRVLKGLYESNIVVVTLKGIKEKKYCNTTRVITFENLLQVAESKCLLWKGHTYTPQQMEAKTNARRNQASKHKDKDFILKYYATLGGELG